MVMRNRVRWVILLVATMASTSLGVWNPSTDPCLVFNMDFENHTHDTNTIDSKSGLVGDVENKSADPNTPFVTTPDPNVKFGTSCDLRSPVDLGGTDVESCRITINKDAHAENSNPLFHDVFDLGQDANTVLTFTAWFGHHDGSGTIIGQRYNSEEFPTYFWWQFRLQGGRILMDAKYNNNDVVRMATQKTLLQMDMNNTDWHHATVVFDRRGYAPGGTYDSKIYIDGAPVKVDYFGHDANEAYMPEDPCVFIGGGDTGLFDDWDGMLDEIRIYRRVLSDTEISLLYQWTPTNTGPWALLPLPNYTQVSIYTGLGWEPVAGADTQNLIFGTDPNLDNQANVLVTLSDLEGDDDAATNVEIGGPLDFNSVYYWRVDTNDSDIITKGPVWKFTTDVGYAIDPVPADGATGVEVGPVDLRWTGSPDACNFDVYLSENASMDPNTQVADNTTDSNVMVFTGADPCVGKKYYWQVVTNFETPIIPGPAWNFRTGSVPIVVNTADFVETYNGVDYNALTMTFTDTAIVVNGNLGTDDVVIFNLNDHNNITEEYEFFVIPEFNDTVQDEANALSVRQTSRPMAIHVTGNFIFDGRMDISGETVTAAVGNKTYSPYGRCGGYRGPRNNDGDAKVSPEESQYGGYWHDADTNDRFLDALQGTLENKTRYVHFITSVPFGAPTRYAASGKSMFGPGGASSGAQNTGGGGGYGGIGGDSGHGWDFGNFEGGVPYGDREVPVPFGGSAGGFGKNSPNPAPGASGGGGVEIAATGDITLGPNAQIVAEGGSAYNGCDYAGGGGAGGSVRMIAGGSVSIAETAVISVNGGNGGNTNTLDEPKAGGGGAGGRVAIWYGGGGTCNGEEVITAYGGAPGTISGGAPSWAEAGRDGTIYVSNGDRRKASAPTPRNGDKIVYVAGGAGTVTLKWCSGYGGATDRVYFGTTIGGLVPVPDPCDVAATRGEHSKTSPAVVAGTKYYWKIRTDNAVDSDIWSFKVVGWYCDETKFNLRAQWDTGPYNNCCVDFEDFAYFVQFWFQRNNMYWGPPDSATDTITGAGIAKFVSEWLQTTGRTP